ncbi:MAG: hypothetical protein GY828_03545 [Candidatus Gracilibacteria bacterium]|nr:hypothetical protein [Candidatus Gracilibacteria bacterium]
MQYVFIGFKVLLNIFFYAIYSIISMILGGWIYGFILTNSGKTIPGAEDSVHDVLGIIILVFVLIITLFFRKYLYISLKNTESDTPREYNVNNGDKQHYVKDTSETIEKIPKREEEKNNYIEDKKPIINKIDQTEKKPKIEILLDKEIK